MKFILKPSKKGDNKDFISKISDDVDKLKELISEACGIKEVLEEYKKGSIKVKYEKSYSDEILSIKMNDLMVAYLKDRLHKVEKRIRETVV